MRVLWWLFASSAGAVTRTRVLLAIREEPRNARRLKEALDLDYTTVRHHLRVLTKNGFLLTGGPKYGQLFFLSPSFESHWAAFEKIAAKVAPENPGGPSHGAS